MATSRPLVTIAPCHDGKGNLRSWTISAPGVLIAASTDPKDIQGKFAHVVASFLQHKQEVDFEDQALDGTVRGWYDLKGVRHLSEAPRRTPTQVEVEEEPATPRTRKSSARPAAATVAAPAAKPARPKANSGAAPVAAENRGGRGKAHPGLHKGAEVYQRFVSLLVEGGLSFEQARSRWALRKNELRTVAAAEKAAKDILSAAGTAEKETKSAKPTASKPTASKPTASKPTASKPTASKPATAPKGAKAANKSGKADKGGKKVTPSKVRLPGE